MATTAMKLTNSKLVLLFRRLATNTAARSLASTASSSSPPPPPSPSAFMAGYLMDRVGFNEEKATALSKRFPSVTSPDKPDAVLRFLRSEAGLSPAQIRRFVRCRPASLFADVRSSLLPKLNLLSSLLPSSESPSKDLAKLVAACAPCFGYSTDHRLVPTLLLLRDLLGRDDRKVASVLLRCPRILGACSDKQLRRNLAILHGRPGLDLPALVHKCPHLLIKSPDTLDSVFRTAEEELGRGPSSEGHLDAVYLSALFSKETFLIKLAIIRSYGFNSHGLFTLLRRCPLFVRLTNEHMRKKLDFLIRTVGLSTSSLLSNTWQLLFSLELRLVPRYELLRSLQSIGLLPPKLNFSKAFAMTQHKFNVDYVYKFLNGEGSDVVQSYMKSPTFGEQSLDPSKLASKN